MSILKLKDIIDKITDSNILYKIYEYSEDNYLDKLDSNNVLNISKEVIFIIALKLMTPRNFGLLKSVNINLQNEVSELKHSLHDIDSLFDVFLYDNFRSNFFIFNGQKIYNGDCTLSKHEIIQNFLYDNIKMKIKSKRYYQVNISESNYLDLIDKVLELMEYDINEIMIRLDDIIDSFIKSVEISGRIFVVDLILRDYYSLLKMEINRLEGEGYKIKKISDTNIFFV